MCTFASHTVMTFDSDIIFSGEGVGGFSIIYAFGICCSDLQRFPEVMLVVNFLMGVSAENCFCTFANNFLNIVSPYYFFGHFHRRREGGRDEEQWRKLDAIDLISSPKLCPALQLALPTVQLPNKRRKPKKNKMQKYKTKKDKETRQKDKTKR